MSELCWLGLVLSVGAFLFFWHWLGDKTEELEETMQAEAEKKLVLKAKLDAIKEKDIGETRF